MDPAPGVDAGARRPLSSPLSPPQTLVPPRLGQGAAVGSEGGGRGSWRRRGRGNLSTVPAVYKCYVPRESHFRSLVSVHPTPPPQTKHPQHEGDDGEIIAGSLLPVCHRPILAPPPASELKDIIYATTALSECIVHQIYKVRSWRSGDGEWSQERACDQHL